MTKTFPEEELVTHLTISSAQTVALSALLSFERVGFHATSTRDITEHASLSAGSLYTFFKSKEDILYFWMLTGHRSALSATRAAFALAGTATERVSHIVTELTLWHIRYQKLSRLSGTQLKALSDEHYQVIRELRREIVECIRTPIQEGIEAGEFTVSDQRLAINAIFAMVLDVSRWYRATNQANPETVATQYAAYACAILGATTR